MFMNSYGQLFYLLQECVMLVNSSRFSDYDIRTVDTFLVVCLTCGMIQVYVYDGLDFDEFFGSLNDDFKLKCGHSGDFRIFLLPCVSGVYDSSHVSVVQDKDVRMKFGI